MHNVPEDPAAPFINKHNEAAALVQRMSLQEKAACASGKSFWNLQDCKRLDLPAVMITDGPHGLRKQASAGDHVGADKAIPATCFPTASALAASWDERLIAEVGVALGEQCVAENVVVLLGPGMNIKRHPLCGRNFEYFSEDPFLSGKMAAAIIKGIQSQGVGASIKHYAVNNQEQGRMYIDAIVDERALREIYLKGFEIAVREAQPWTVMCAYNRVNGTYCSDHDWLLNRVLRDEWGFKGLVMTDWGATNDRVKGVSAGLDLEMPASGGINDRLIERAIESGELAESVLDEIIVRNVSLSLCGRDLADQAVSVDQVAHHSLARKAAAQSAVLLKNDAGMLPISGEADIAVIGAFAKQPRYQGTGSSRVNTTQIDCAFDAIAAHHGGSGQIAYAAGYEPVHSEPDQRLIDEAVRVARNSALAIVFAGLPETYESEGFDRPHMDLPDQHNRLIQSVCGVNPNTVVVLCNGAPVSMPWVNEPRAILECYLGGQAGGSAAADLLFGAVNPSGKLAETFPLQQSDVPSDPWFPGAGRQVQYREGIYVGYRYFDTADKPTLFPFGHGLSYTQFEFSNLGIEKRGSDLMVTLDITNTGGVAGAEVVQLYVSALASDVHRPAQELKAFTKTFVDPGATERVELTLSRQGFEIFDPQEKCWIVEAGAYEVRIGSSSRDIRLRQTLNIESDDMVSDALRAVNFSLGSDGMQVSDEQFAGMLGRKLPEPESARPFHINSSLQELAQNSWLGKRIRARAFQQFTRSLNLDAAKMDATLLRMFESMIDDMPIRAFALFGQGKVDFNQLNALVAVLNHQYGRALGYLLKQAKRNREARL